MFVPNYLFQDYKIEIASILNGKLRITINIDFFH